MLRLIVETVIDLGLLYWISQSIPGGLTLQSAIPVIVFGLVQYTEAALKYSKK